ncbi:hypothetical protein ACFC58_08415 [Kitasatospora purpeofusca]|uniref:hypothetical protein n=1 Tax=Kitasatospora purpeofusca TaxID=67352 RepID=UPI0035D8C67E
MTRALDREISRPVGRVVPDDLPQHSSAEEFERFLTEFGAAQLAELRGRRRYPDDLAAATPPLQDGGELVEDFNRDLLESYASRLRPELAELTVNLQPGSQVVAAPYDNSWQTGLGLPLSRLDGHMTLLGGDTFSGAGFSFFVQATASASVVVTPQGTYEHTFFDLQTHPNLQTRGGAGAIVYRNTVQDVKTEITLWNRVGMSPTSGETVRLGITDLVGLSGGPFPGSRLFPVVFDINPGDTCEVWIYLWNACSGTTGTPFLCTQVGIVPMVTLNAGPPFVGPH